MEHTARIEWMRNGQTFRDNKYSRRHRWRFDGGAEVPGSSSPHSVPLPFSDASAVDPEEALVAAVSSCHMLWFLSLAAKRGLVVDEYRDDAAGTMGKNSDGQLAITRIALRPSVRFSVPPAPGTVEALHHEAHELCALAHSVRAEVVIEAARNAVARDDRP